MTFTRKWDDARAKVDEEAACRGCGRPVHVLERLGFRLEAAHITGRANDRLMYLAYVDAEWGWVLREQPGRVLYVAPVRVVPLCGPATDHRTCHHKYDHHKMDLLPKLTREEQAQAVLDMGTISLAFRRLTGGKVEPDPQHAHTRAPGVVLPYDEE